MPRRPVLTATEREQLLAFPGDRQQRLQHYTLSDSDLAVIGERRGQENRLGFAVQLCYLPNPAAWGAEHLDPLVDHISALIDDLVSRTGK